MPTLHIQPIDFTSHGLIEYLRISVQLRFLGLRLPNHENALDKQIAATALTYGLSLVTRNVDDLVGTGVRLINPFE